MCNNGTSGDSCLGLMVCVWGGGGTFRQYLCPVHGLGVHGVLFDLLVEFVESLPEDSPQCGFS